jgi:thioredoxin reductase
VNSLPDPRFGYDVAVLGAGPAGAAAAVEAAALGLRAAIIDLHPVAGGHAYRAVPGIAPIRSDQERTDGDKVRAALGAANVVRYFAHRVRQIERVEPLWHLQAIGAAGPRTIHAARLIVTTGAQERLLPFAGWERPGVMGLAAATIMLKAQRVLPGRNTVVAGAGPLLLLVAKAIVDGGGSVAAIVDAHPRSAWFASATELLSRPDLATRGMNWYRALHARGVPMHNGYLLREVTGDAPTLRATAVPVDRDGRARTDAPIVACECDAVCCGFGLMPAMDVTRMLGASHAFDPALGGWHVVVDDDQRCNVAGLYAAGDGAGVVGAAAAPWQGRIAAMAAARDAGKLSAGEHEARVRAAKRECVRAARFGSAMTRLANVGDGAVAMLAPDVTVCQCERLTRAAIDAAIAGGCTTMADLEAATRCGMGPCGGRLCEESAARLITLATGRTRVDVGQFPAQSTPRATASGPLPAA